MLSENQVIVKCLPHVCCMNDYRRFLRWGKQSSRNLRPWLTDMTVARSSAQMEVVAVYYYELMQQHREWTRAGLWMKAKRASSVAGAAGRRHWPLVVWCSEGGRGGGIIPLRTGPASTTDSTAATPPCDDHLPSLMWWSVFPRAVQALAPEISAAGCPWQQQAENGTFLLLLFEIYKLGGCYGVEEDNEIGKLTMKETNLAILLLQFPNWQERYVNRSVWVYFAGTEMKIIVTLEG